MKKKLIRVFCFALVVGIICSNIFPLLKNKINQNEVFATTETVETSYYGDNGIDLLSTNPGAISNATIETNCSPFDIKTKKRLPGSLVTPNADDYGQITSFSCLINSFSPTENQSVYLWIYLISALTFQLKISVYDGISNKVEWAFNSTEVYSMGTGWKLLELKFSDKEESLYTGKTFNNLIIKYNSEINDLEDSEEIYEVSTKERFSFYHVFLAEETTKRDISNVVCSLDRTFYKFADGFLSSGKIFEGDKFVVNSPNDIFSYLYVDKYDLSNLSVVGKYVWVMIFTYPDSTEANIDFGDTVKFVSSGSYKFTIRLYEKNLLNNNLIMNAGINVYCEEICLGDFIHGESYTISEDDKVTIPFKLAEGIEICDDKIEVSVNNNNAEIYSYYEDNGTLYICVKANNSGISKLEINAQIKSRLNTKQQSFTAQATINISSNEEKFDLFMFITWCIFGAFCVGFVVYLVISLVNARKNDVK